MKIFVNERNEILDVGETRDSSLTPYEVDDEMFKGWSIAKICCYKVYVSLGKVCGFTPYVDSRLIEHIEQLGQSTEINKADISDNREGLIETFDSTITNSDDIADCREAIIELYDMILGSEV